MWRKRTAWLSVAGGLLVAVAGLAVANPFRWTGLGDRTWLWTFVGAAGLGTLCATCVRLAVAGRGPARLASALAAVGLCLAALVAAGGGLLVLAFRGGDQRVVATSPDGRFEVVVHDTSNIIDPVQGAYVQTTNGPFSRRAYLGCFNSESGASVESARFVGPDTVTLEGTKRWELRFDSVNVRSIETVEEGACTRQLYTG
ncbi:hypothetical protein OG979_09670 [Actinomadura citrea]|uniref:hypothetical protein n=1 Tax=Actinomadura citrea TaxID=46158 RepID=UPI002E2E521D|nr:hypothetical protein [Actinomadura citrea]